MPTFIYKAKDGPDKTVEGEIEAESRQAAVSSVDALGLSPVWVREKTAQLAGKRIKRRHRVAGRDITVFTQQLASLIRSGVPILRALRTVREQTGNKALAGVVGDLERDVREGGTLSQAMRKHPRLFSELYINMIKSGESGGILEEVLQRLADAREQEEETRKKVQASMAYPALVVVVGVLTVFVLLTFFLPNVIELFSGYESLPFPTRVIISVSNFFSNYWLWMLAVLLLFMAVLKRLASFEKGRTFLDRLKLNMPLVKGFILQSGIARFARTLALLIDAGIPIDRALSLSGATLGNAVLKDEIEEVRRNTVQRGATVSSGLKKSRWFPPMVSNMAGVGEEAGRLDQSMNEIAAFYEREIDRHSKTVASLLEPVLILVVGLVVGFIVAAMLLPIFEVSSLIE